MGVNSCFGLGEILLEPAVRARERAPRGRACAGRRAACASGSSRRYSGGRAPLEAGRPRRDRARGVGHRRPSRVASLPHPRATAPPPPVQEPPHPHLTSSCPRHLLTYKVLGYPLTLSPIFFLIFSRAHIPTRAPGGAESTGPQHGGTCVGELDGGAALYKHNMLYRKVKYSRDTSKAYIVKLNF